MFLKGIEILGFKSFAERTNLEFSRGVTGIVGPNGCGKSNVVDAIRWVLGETSAKALRGDEMADVIFSGTDQRKPLGAAEVTLTLADCEQALDVDFNELAIGRRVSREGKGEYFINGSRCRLRDVHELLADTGIGRSAYSIMAQGQIDQILSSRPEDRRAVFEEAAGITRFKQQKKEALRKLEHTDGNLLRVTDVIEEVGRQRNSLQRQAAKARRFAQVKAELRVLEGHFLYRQWLLLAQQEQALRADEREAGRRVEALEEAVVVRERGLGASRQALGSLDERIEGLKGRSGELDGRLQRARQRIVFNEERCVEFEEGNARAQQEIERAQRGLDDQQGLIAQADEQIGELERGLGQRRQRLEAALAELKEVKGKRERLARELAGVRQRVQQSSAKRAGIEARLEQQQQQLEQLEPRMERFEEQGRELEQLGEQERARVLQQEGALERMEADVEALQESVRARELGWKEVQGREKRVRAQWDGARREVARLESRLQVMEQVLAAGEGLDEGTQAVLKGLPGRDGELLKNGVRGVLASFLTVREAQLQGAIEAVLGERLQAVVLADDAVLEATANVLVERRLGRALLVSERVAAAGGDWQMEALPRGARAWALDVVEVDAKVATLVQRLLAGVLIVEDLAVALELRERLMEQGAADWTLVGLDGQLVGRQGLVQAGAVKSGAAGASLLQRQRELSELAGELEGARVQEREGREQHVKVAEQVEGAAAEVDEGRTRLQELKGELSGLRAGVRTARKDAEAAGNRLQNLGWERQQLEKRKGELGVSLDEGRRQLEAVLQAQRQSGESVEGMEEGLQQLATAEQQRAEVVSERRTELAVEERSLSSLHQQRRPMGQRLAELQDLLLRRKQEIVQLQRKREQAQQENVRLRAELEQGDTELQGLEAELKQALTARGKRREQLESVRVELEEMQRELAGFQGRKGKLEVQLTQLELKLDHLEAQGRERLQLVLPRFVPDWGLMGSVLAGGEAPALDLEAEVAAGDGGDGGDGDEGEEGDGGEEGDAGGDVGRLDLAQLRLPEEVDWGALERRVTELRRKQEMMGPVNLDAIVEFEELVQRHEFLQEQHEDLTQAKEVLLLTIERLNKESRTRFVETFGQVRENFRRIFAELFGQGAQANLVLVDEDEPLESGIEVIAKPPGKKLQSITLLSGGERSMTAVALLFSIYQVKPSPFCVLDELDAPLDETNIGRFVGMLDRFIDQSQFIIVTHSKRTMQRCDVLYGVTMQEFGVSRPVGMRLGPEQAGEGS